MPSIYHWHCTLWTGFFFSIIRVTQRFHYTVSLPSTYHQNKFIWCVCALHTATYSIIFYSHPKTHIKGKWKLVCLNALHFFVKRHLSAIFLRHTVSKLYIRYDISLCLMLKTERLLQASHVHTWRSFVGHIFNTEKTNVYKNVIFIHYHVTTVMNLTLYAPCVILQYVYKPTRCTEFLWLDFIFH